MGEEIHFLIFPFSGVHEVLTIPHEVVNQSRNGGMKKGVQTYVARLRDTF